MPVPVPSSERCADNTGADLGWGSCWPAVVQPQHPVGPLWVISRHKTHPLRTSALPPKADIGQPITECLLSATRRHSRDVTCPANAILNNSLIGTPTPLKLNICHSIRSF